MAVIFGGLYTESAQWSFSWLSYKQWHHWMPVLIGETEISLLLDMAFHLIFCSLTIFSHFHGIYEYFGHGMTLLSYFYWCYWMPWFYCNFFNFSKKLPQFCRFLLWLSCSPKHGHAAKFTAVARPAGDIDWLLHVTQQCSMQWPTAGSAMLTAYIVAQHRL